MKPDGNDSPTTWFCLMESAIRCGDRKAELEARRQLARLGVLVTVDARSVLVQESPPRAKGKRKAGGA